MKKKLKGATLMEALVAMIIIMVVYMLALFTFVNIGKSNNSRLKLQAFLRMEEVSGATKKEKLYIDQDFDFENMKIEKKVEQFESDSGLKVLHFKVFDKQAKLIIERRELIAEH